MSKFIRYDVSVNDRELEQQATRILRAAGLTADGREKAQAADAPQRAFERTRVHCCPFGGYSRSKR